MNDNILIPQYVTQWGVLTSFIVLAFSFIAYKLKYNLLCFATLCLFITSVIHWHKMTLFGPIKILDVLCATISLGLITFYYINFLKIEYRKIWYCTVSVMILIYLINWVITYFQIMKSESFNNDYKCQTEYNYFSLDYTKPYTEAREQSYYYVTWVHLLCVHLMPGIVLSYCFLMP